jgi:hypothetical protein
MEKVMNTLGIEMAKLHGKDVQPIVDYNQLGTPIDGGRYVWLITL